MRIGGRKAMTLLAGRPMVAHVANLLEPAVAGLAVAGSAEAASALGVPNLDDPPDVARGAEWIVTAPCDTPLLPAGFATRILEEEKDADAAFA